MIEEVKMVNLARSPEQIGNAIRRARKRAGMSQSELGERTGLRQGTISQIEKGHAAAKLETILGVLSALNLEFQITPRVSEGLIAMPKATSYKPIINKNGVSLGLLGTEIDEE